MARQQKLAAIHANVGIEVEFRRKLESMLAEMDASLTYWLTAAYRANKPATANDASPAATLNAIMKRLTRKWTRKFSEAAKPMADYYAQAAKDRTDASLKAALKKAGMTVKFVVTPEIQDIMTATVAENVSLIKTIAIEHLADVEQLVMRSAQVGRDLGGLRQALQDRYGITKRRASLIARQSNNNTSAALRNARYDELGITEAQWIHSNGGHTPRHEHVKWNGTMYNIKTGKWSEVSQKFVWPGTDFNCRCGSRATLKTANIATRING